MLSNFPHLNRRHFMKHLAGSMALAAPTLNFVSTLQAQTKSMAKAGRHCILVWLGGGPPTLDFFNVFPGEANSGPMENMKTKVPGLEINELLPTLAGVADKLAIIKALNGKEGDHARGTERKNSMGHDPSVRTLGVRLPASGSVFSALFQASDQIMPSWVTMGGSHGDNGFLPTACAPFAVQNAGTPPENIEPPIQGDPGYRSARIARRESCLSVLERAFTKEVAPHVKDSERANLGDPAYQHMELVKKATDCMKAGTKVFTFNADDQKKLEKYGNTGLGRQCLLARKLVEAGTTFVTVNEGGWDLHNNVFGALNTKLPVVDKAVGNLIAELAASGLLATTTVVMCGDFNRTPRINQNTGRDHWAATEQVLLAGGGIKGGMTYGETTPDNMQAKSGQVTTGNMWATVLEAHEKGILANINKDGHDNLGRRHKWTDGGKDRNADPIKDLLA